MALSHASKGVTRRSMPHYAPNGLRGEPSSHLLPDAKGNCVSIGALVLGVFTGSILWWAILSSVIGSLRDKFRAQNWQWVNKISGILITGFGLAVLLSLIF
jgi:threonine/homoserine/homoserine lactone efflux protein